MNSSKKSTKPQKQNKSSEIPLYLPRVVDAEVARKLKSFGAINIVGCKWCGKTRTAEQFAKSVFEFENPENSDMVELAKSQIKLALDGEKPRLIDEWQDMPEIWDAVRYAVDRVNRPNQYILTGSATPRKKRPKHSGAGRFATVTMRPMSLFESGDSTGEVSLAKLFESEFPALEAPNITFEELAYLCARGGWPSTIAQKSEDPLLFPREYIDTILNREESFTNLDFYSPKRMAALLRSLARHTSTPVRLTTIQQDITENSGIPISDTTLSSYLAVLEQIYLVDSVEAWSPKLRSKTEIRTTKKRFLVDPSLAVASLSASPGNLLGDVRTFGLIFESLVLRDLKTYASAIDGKVSYYRDRSGR